MSKRIQRHVGQIRDNEIVWTYYKMRQEAIESLPDGTWISETIRPVGKPITQHQLGYYYAVILPTIHKQLVENGIEVMGVPISEDMADTIIKHYCSEGLLKRNMTVKDAKQFIDNAIRWAAVTLGCSIPPPDRNWFNKKG